MKKISLVSLLAGFVATVAVQAADERSGAQKCFDRRQAAVVTNLVLVEVGRVADGDLAKIKPAEAKFGFFVDAERVSEYLHYAVAEERPEDRRNTALAAEELLVKKTGERWQIACRIAEDFAGKLAGADLADAKVAQVNPVIAGSIYTSIGDARKAGITSTAELTKFVSEAVVAGWTMALLEAPKPAAPAETAKN